MDYRQPGDAFRGNFRPDQRLFADKLFWNIDVVIVFPDKFINSIQAMFQYCSDGCFTAITGAGEKSCRHLLRIIIKAG